MNNDTILVIDDEKDIADLVEIHLLNEGFSVFKAHDGNAGLAILARESIQLVVLDIMMPGMDGLAVCRCIRTMEAPEKRSVPLLMLSAKSEDMDKILGLSTGADDYLTKPFNPLELTARIKSQLRRAKYLNPGYSKPDTDSLEISGLAIHTVNHTVHLYGNPVSLTPTEFDILLLLAKNPGRVFSAEEIFERVWKERYLNSDNTVMVHIRKIREKIEENPRKPEFIKTIWGIGYKFMDSSPGRLI